MKQHKIFIWLAGAVICPMLLSAGCAKPAAEITKPKVEPEVKVLPAKPIKEEVAKPQPQTFTLALKFTPQESTTCRVITEAEKGVKFEGTVPQDATFKGGRTSNRTELTFDQQIQKVDEKGNATAKITIKKLKYLTKIKDNIELDFDSERPADSNNPLAKLIGQSYTIETSPSSEVLKVIDVNEAQAVIKGDSAADKVARAILDPNTIKDRHTIAALPSPDKNQRHIADKWSKTGNFSFGLMGSKSYERIYTLKEVKNVNDRRIAVVDMNAAPTSPTEEEQASQAVSKKFENTEIYTGRLTLDTTAGKVEKYSEKLQLEWVTAEPAAEQKADKEPAVLIMSVNVFHSFEKID
jgi:hypothetical protein